MFTTLRTKLLIGLFPLLAILFGLGLWAIYMFSRLGGDIEVILRENYRSVLYAQNMREALERMDSALLFAVAGEDQMARAQFDDNRPNFEHNLQLERNNITLIAEGEQTIADDLTRLYERYLRSAERFFTLGPERTEERRSMYFNELLPTFRQIKDRAAEVLRINQQNMLDMDSRARNSATNSIRLMLGGLFVSLAIGISIGLALSRSILAPVRAVTMAALELGRGNYQQSVPIVGRDELAELARTFNGMAARIRDLQAAGAARLIRARQTAQATIDAFPDPVIVLGQTGIAERANPAARRLLGVAPSEYEANAWVAPEALSGPLAAVLAGSDDFVPTRFDQAIILRDDGLERSLLPRVLAIRDEHGSPLGAAVVLQDVTRFRRLDQLKSDLVSTASHELKTPLTSVQMAVQLLLEQEVGPLTAKQAELLQAACRDAERLKETIDDLLDMTRIEQGRLRLEFTPARPSHLVSTAIEEATHRAREVGVAMTESAPADLPLVRVDPDRIRNVFRNLLDNAIAHTPPGGQVRVSAKQDGPSVRFDVEDTGEGIAAEHLARLFEKFYRVPRTRSPHGAGLGLAITREIVVAHGGTVDVASEVGKGSRFSFTIPAVTPPQSQEQRS
jgi:two-component system, NtrC family, sensor histidine kinase KinB